MGEMEPLPPPHLRGTREVLRGGRMGEWDGGGGSLSEANCEYIKDQEGEWVNNRASAPGGFFETSLRTCLLKLGFSDHQAQDVTK